MFLKQIAGLPCIASDMQITFVRTTPREAFKKTQLLPLLTPEAVIRVETARARGFPRGEQARALEPVRVTSTNIHPSGLLVNPGATRS